MLDISQQFPIFSRHPDLVYLDSAATTQTPVSVLHAMLIYYIDYRANVHRGMYPLAHKATSAYEAARKTVAEFVGAQSDEIIFTSGTTFSLNMLQKSLTDFFEPGGNIVVTRLEHHANLIPWQMTAKKYKLELRFIEINKETGEIDMDSVEKCIDEKTAVVAIAHVSNVTGTIVPVQEIVRIARQKTKGAVVVDGAQAVAHMPVNVKELDCDFYVFSGHKMYGPTGIGAVYGKKELLQKMKPVMYGGEMVETVTYENATWAESPYRFEAGTPNIAGAIGMARACEFISGIGFDSISKHEAEVTKYALDRISEVADIVGPKTTENRMGVISFTIPGVHTHDAADILGRHGVCIRAGHHCAMPLMQHMGLPGTLRASIGVYTTMEDIDRLVEGILGVRKIFNTQ